MANFVGTNDSDIFTGGSENDTAFGNGGNDSLTGNDGDDRLDGNAGADWLSGGNGNDILISFDATNVMYAYDQMTSLDTGTDVDVLDGGDGDDYLVAGYGDQISGGAGYNKLYLNLLGATSGVYADFRQQQNGGSITIGGALVSGITQTIQILGSNFDDTIYTVGSYYGLSVVRGNGGNDLIVGDYYTRDLYGDDGNDTLDGRGSQYLNRVDGGAGNDTLYTASNTFAAAYGGAGDDTIYSHGETYGGLGNDLIILQPANFPARVLGEEGDDEIQASTTSNYVIAGGAGADVLKGNTGNDLLYSADLLPNSNDPAEDSGLEHDVLTGGAGNDTLAAGYGDDVDGGSGTDTLRLSLAGATSGVTFSTVGIAGGTPFTFGGGTIQNIETLSFLRGSNFGDTLTFAAQGSSLTVDAGGGDDVLSWGASSVILNGGDGNDRFINNIAGDQIDGGAGLDTIDYRNAASGVTVTLGLTSGALGSGPGGDQIVRIENLDGSAFGDTFNGSNDANVLLGLGGNDTLKGFGGNDTLDGGVGADSMEGGTGDDSYFIDNAGDQVIEAAGAGFDRISSTDSYALAAGASIEFLSTTDNLATTAINLTGNALSQFIYGNAGANVIDSGGGGDVMIGFEGDDIYYTHHASDRAVESAGGGFDRVLAAASFTLEAGSEVEMFTTIDNLATTAINLTGNALSQYLFGNAGSNILDGGGGGDVMVGFEGDDFYVVRHASDRAVESAGAGFDRVLAAANFTLEAGSHVEMFTTVDNLATTAINLTGNAFGQYLYGNAGANVLDGGGGGDTMVGFEGDDVYYTRDASDRALESTGGGFDRVLAGASFTLEAGSEVEMFTTIDNIATTAIDLTGNAIDQYLYGNDGANRLDGKGGADVLTGFGGADTFAFTTALGGTNIDRVTDYNVADDTIALDDAVFTGLALGTLSANAFVTGTAAQDADDRIIYDPATGALFFDADGNGAGAAVQFATLATGLSLTAGEFTVI